MNIFDFDRGNNQRNNIGGTMSVRFLDLSNSVGNRFNRIVSASIRGIILEQARPIDVPFYPLDMDISHEDLIEYRLGVLTSNPWDTNVGRNTMKMVDALAYLWVDKIRQELATWSVDNPNTPASVVAQISHADTITHVGREALPVYAFVNDIPEKGLAKIQVETAVNFKVVAAEK
jgi:hypothetical protein